MKIDLIEINNFLHKELLIYALVESVFSSFVATSIIVIIMWPIEKYSFILITPAVIISITSFYSRYFYVFSTHKKLFSKYEEKYLIALTEKLKNNDIRKLVGENWFFDVEKTLESK